MFCDQSDQRFHIRFSLGFWLGSGGVLLAFEVAWIDRSRFESFLFQLVFLVAIAEGAVAAQVAIFDVEPRIIEAQLLLQIEQFDRFSFVQIGDSTKLLRQQQDSAISVEDFRLPIGVFQRLAEGDGPVVGQDDRVRSVLQERYNGVAFNSRAMMRTPSSIRSTAIEE